MVRPSATGDLPVTVDIEPADTAYRQFLEALGVAVYTTEPDGRITFYNEAAADLWGRRPEVGEQWCGSWRLYWPDGRPMAHDECPMAIALKTERAVRGYEAVAERPDGSRVSFVPFPTVLAAEDGTVVGAVNVLVDVTERRRMEDALRTANAVRDDFMGLVSHELRTPITTILGNARLMSNRTDPSDPRTPMIADIAGDAERLDRVVGNLLILAKGDVDAAFEREPHLLVHVLREIVDEFRREHHRPVELRAEAPHLIVEADRGSLELVVGNLLGNAHKYSPADGPISVVLSEVDEMAHVTVLDRGVGIHDDEAEVIFDAFYRSDGARSTSSGLGIGLSACRQAVSLLGGKIWGRSREGGGSEFAFTLPLAETYDT